ncbi:MAG: hypothetical protein C7B46_01935 [Sulfobacillus benefaciens]|uniref:SPW repeat-containing integral membrane domain-containing protein n=1 Tax=Sulfobacillus benefaciens TaxID=453960 RepID=A0A2T2XL26_9FIRM|nr:MAG: hypothetical protein C7B46_01935 [Sulfobacillus benefaciens]
MRGDSWISSIALLAGIWVAVSPFVVGFSHPVHKLWPASILGPVILGGIVAVISLAGLVGFWGIQLRDWDRPKRSTTGLRQAR